MLFLLALFLLLVFIMIIGSNGMRNFDEHILNDYVFTYPDRNLTGISYRGDERGRGKVITARVDEYRVEGNKIFVARRPNETFRKESGALGGRLLNICEYWVIDTETHQVSQLEKGNAKVACQ